LPGSAWRIDLRRADLEPRDAHFSISINRLDMVPCDFLMENICHE
jgi:hypothetical protein